MLYGISFLLVILVSLLLFLTDVVIRPMAREIDATAKKKIFALTSVYCFVFLFLQSLMFVVT